MPANITPIFPLTPVVGFGTLSAANNVYDGTGTQVTLLTAGLNGTRLDSVKVKHLGTNTTSVLRLFLNNGNSNAIPGNNTLITEISIPSNTASASSASSEQITINLDISIPAGYKLNACLGTAVASGLSVTVFGGDY